MSDHNETRDNMIDLDAIEARANAATRGPWEAVVDDHGFGRAREHSVWAGTTQGAYVAEFIDTEAHAQFIAHARADIPALVAEVRRLREVVAQQEADADELHEWVSGRK